MKLKSFLHISLGLFITCVLLSNFTQSVSAQQAVSIQSLNYPDLYIRHKNYLGYIENTNDDLSKKDASYKMVPGLANSSCASLESINFPGYFLRHQNMRIKLTRKENTTLLKKDATFCRKNGLFGQQGVSFESINIPGHFIRHKNTELWIDPSDGSDLFRKDATFSLVDSLAK
jgi:hypothetical protein